MNDFEQFPPIEGNPINNGLVVIIAIALIAAIAVAISGPL